MNYSIDSDEERIDTINKKEDKTSHEGKIIFLINETSDRSMITLEVIKKKNQS